MQLGNKTARRASRLALTAMTAVLAGSVGFISPAHGLIDSGPAAADTGMPSWFEDSNGLSLQACPTGAVCGTPTGAEFPFWDANARIPLPQGRLEVDLGLFGGYTNGTIAPANAFAFSRIRLRAQGLAPSTSYVVTYPYGVSTLTTDSSGKFDNNVVTGCTAAPCDWATVVATSPFKQFLVWDPAMSPPPAGSVGDGVTAHTLIGSPTGNNFFDVKGTNAGGTGINEARTNLFTLVGQIATGPFKLAGAPLTLIGTAGPGAGNATLQWTKPALDGGTAITKYNVYGGLDAANLALLGSVPAASPLTFSDSGRPNGALMHYAVTSVNAVGESLRSLVDVQMLATPTAPQSLGATAGPGVGQISLSWLVPASAGSTPISGYRVYGGPDVAHMVKVADVAATATSFVDSGRGEGETVHYAVSAMNSIGESVRSAEAFATTFARPSVVQAFTAAPGSLPTQIALKWQAPATNGGTNVTGYHIYRRDSLHKLALVATVGGGARSWTDTGLVPATAYTYQISAVNMVGDGARATTCTHASPWVNTLAPAAPCA